MEPVLGRVDSGPGSESRAPSWIWAPDLAAHVGHSRKLGLSPAERADRVVAGQYGVGLLGFWAVGGRLELRTRVQGRVGCPPPPRDRGLSRVSTQSPLAFENEEP